MKTTIYNISDLHLEDKSIKMREFILNNINKQLSEIKLNGINPLLIVAGDLNNGTKGLEFLSKINNQVIYICGNHEYWKNDYNRVSEEIKNNLPSNVIYLDNDFAEIGDKIIIGATLWTDVAINYNKELTKVSNSIMNDMHYITYESWYTEENIARLPEYFHPYEIENLLTTKKWNILSEIDENRKTTDFYNNFALMHKLVSIIKNKSDDYIAFEDAFKLYDDYSNIDSNKCKKIYEKLFNMNLDNKIVSVSHHIPFYEEVLIARNNENAKETDTVFSYLDKQEYFNYKYMAGSVASNLNRHGYSNAIHKSSMLQSIHYCNNGAENISLDFIKLVSGWIHGHDHYLNCQDYIKGIPFLTNPLGHLEYKVDWSNDEKFIVSKNHQSGNLEEDNNYFKTICNHIKEFNLLDSPKELDALSVWILKNYDFKNYLEEYQFLNKELKKLYSIVVKQQDETKWNDKTNQTIKSLSKSISATINTIEEIKKDLIDSLNIRLEKDYSIFKSEYIPKKRTGNILNYISIYNPERFGSNTINYDLYEISDRFFSVESYLTSIYSNIILTEENISKFNVFKLAIDNIGYVRIENYQDIDTQSISKLLQNNLSIEKNKELMDKHYALSAKYEVKTTTNKYDF